VGAVVGATVGASSVGATVDGANVAVGTRCVVGVAIAVSVGASVGGEFVAVGDNVFVGASDGDEIFVAVAGELVATTITTRAVGKGKADGKGADAHAPKRNAKNKKKSERNAFACQRDK
jgi:hypothetical protein